MVEVSIIISCYNSQDFIVRCILSILNQTFQNFEIILVDDGSINRDIENVRYYSDKIRLICNPHLGVSVARNKGVSVAAGRYLMFVDSDDELVSNALEVALLHMKRNEVDAVFYNTYMHEHGQNKIDNSKFIDARSNQFVERVVAGSTYFVESVLSNNYLEFPCLYLIKTDIVKKHNFPGGMFFEDSVIVMTTKLLLSGDLKRIWCAQDGLYVRYARDNSTTESIKASLYYKSTYAFCDSLSNFSGNHYRSSEMHCLFLYLRNYFWSLISYASKGRISILDKIQFIQLVFRCKLLPKKMKVELYVVMLLVSVRLDCIKAVKDFIKIKNG